MIKYLLLFFGISTGLYPAPAILPVASAPTVGVEEISGFLDPKIIKEVKTVWVTAYSSTPEETDDTPFITASGKRVRDGIVATNFLPFGTKVQIPELFGEKTFTVEDRMHTRKTNFVDVWMATKEDALYFGIAKTDIVVLE